MASFTEVRRKNGPDICRKCINRVCNVTLIPSDCAYYIYPAICSRCGEKQHIVARLRWTGKCKLLFRKMIRADANE